MHLFTSASWRATLGVHFAGKLYNILRKSVLNRSIWGFDRGMRISFPCGMFHVQLSILCPDMIDK